MSLADAVRIPLAAVATAPSVASGANCFQDELFLAVALVDVVTDAHFETLRTRDASLPSLQLRLSIGDASSMGRSRKRCKTEE